MDDSARDEGLTGRYQAAFSVFMGMTAFLWRGTETLSDPGLLGLFGLLMAVNLAASRALRSRPDLPALAAAATLANCGVVAAIVARSGAGDSPFWVLYLLPIFSSCLVLRGRETALVAGGALALNAAGCARDAGVWAAEDTLGLAVKSGVLLLAAAVTYRLAARERGARSSLAAARERVREKAALAEAGLRGAGVAHDLGNALTVILGFTDVALQAEGLSEEVARDLAAIRRSALLAKRISWGFLRLSRGGEEPGVALLDRLIDETLELALAPMTRARVTLRREPAPGEPAVRVSRTSIQRLLMNLVSNAVRAMPEGGLLVVQTSVNGDYARVVVEDNGPGLPPAILAALFRAFARGGAEDGHGLGLYLCAEAARENGGTLRAENKPEGGARFTLTLPLSSAPAVEGGAAAPSAAV